jgi:poly-gamma-glutamate synthesis protein (capsule biosynthesis protein)
MSIPLFATPLLFPNAPPPGYASCPLTAVEVVLAGDAMMHGMQLSAARRPDGTYSLDGVFDEVAPIVRAADLSIVNLETTTAGEDLLYSGYPLFNSPVALLDSLAEAGFDVLQTANNHCLDRGEIGVRRTLAALDERALGHSGTYGRREDRQRPWTWTTLDGGLDVAFIGYTFSTNGEPIPKGKPWMVNRLDLGQMDRDVANARSAGADLVIVGIHWGVEYRDQPEAYMVWLGDRMVEAGADIVMGTHPHVVQPAVVRPATNAYGEPRDALVLYSLGNFVSNQRAFRRDGALLARVEVLHCEAMGRTWLSDVRFTPTWVDDRSSDGRRSFRVVPAVGDGLCTDLDMDVRDCERQKRHVAHLGTLYDPVQFDWTAGSPSAKAAVLASSGFDPTGWRLDAPFSYFAAAWTDGSAGGAAGTP